MVENHRNLCRFRYLDNAIFQPSKIYPVWVICIWKNGSFKISFPKKILSEKNSEKAFKTTIFRQTIVKNGGFKSFF